MTLDTSEAPQSRLASTRDQYDIVIRLTLILILLSPGISGVTWSFKLPLFLGAILGLCCPPLHRRAELWWAMTAVMSWKTIVFWGSQDNHVFLYTYWCLAIAGALSLKEVPAVLATSARWLISGSFACAMVWKAWLSEDFLDGTFFYYTLLTDNRFYDFGRLLGGLDRSIVQYNQTVLRELATSAIMDVHIQLQSTPYLWILAKGITWWTLGLEGAIVLAFVCSFRCRWALYRHILLLLFACTTYLVATVETFGLLLMILGIAQCEPSYRYIRLGYLATFGLILVYDQFPLLSFL